MRLLLAFAFLLAGGSGAWAQCSTANYPACPGNNGKPVVYDSINVNPANPIQGNGSALTGITANGITSLTGDATATGPGSAAASVGNLSHVTNGSLPNSGLANPSVTVNGTSCALGGSCSPVPASVPLSNITGLGAGVAAALANAANGTGGFVTTPAAYSGASIDLNFAAGQYFGTPSPASLLSVTRASPATTYGTDASGNLIPFAANALRITSQGLLIEPTAATNVVVQSQFAASWSVSGNHSTLTANNVISPDNTTDAASLFEDSSNNSHNMSSATFTTPSTALTYTMSFFARVHAGSSPRGVAVTLFDGSFDSSQALLVLNLSTGIGQWETLTGFSGGPISCQAAAQSYWRCAAVFTTPATANIVAIVGLLNTSAFPYAVSYTGSYLGDGASGVDLYGMQIELGNEATSYIPTTTTAVTRSAEVVTFGGAAVPILGGTTGSALIYTQAGTQWGATANLLTANSSTLLGFTSSGALTDGLVSSLTTTNTANLLAATDRSALAWNGSGRSLVLNGGTPVTDTHTQTPSAPFVLSSNGAYVSRLTLWNTYQSSLQSFFPLVSGASVFGLAVAGAENSSPVFPTSGDWTYLNSLGVKTVRLALAWENLQPTLNGALSSGYVTSINSALASANAQGIGVVLDVHNYGHYANSTAWGSTVTTAGNGGNTLTNVLAIGDAGLPTADYTNLCTRMATQFGGTPGLVGFGMMNEPNNFPSGNTAWQTAAQACIPAYRAVDAATPIYVPGDGSINPGGVDAVFFQPTNVTGAGLISEAHQYFDFNPASQNVGPGSYSGSYTSYSTNNYAGIQAILSWLSWLKINGQTGWLGEFNVPNDATDSDPQWLILQHNFLSLLAQQRVKASMYFYGANNSGSGGKIQVNPVGAVTDPRVVQMLGNF